MESNQSTCYTLIIRDSLSDKSEDMREAIQEVTPEKERVCAQNVTEGEEVTVLNSDFPIQEIEEPRHQCQYKH